MSMIFIHREGRFIFLIAAIILILSNLAIFQLFPGHEYLNNGLTIVSIFLLSFILYFFRNPNVVLEHAENNEVLSPCDGRVVVIEEVDEMEYFNDKRLQVSIFMSPTNVHVNRSPVGGIVKYLKYHPGDYLVAWHPKSSEKNERFTTVIGDGEMEVLMRQIAGKMARKISNYLEEGEQIFHGKELGFIKFGSRVDLFLPLNSKINIKLNDKVKAGKTILASVE